jgi:heat shock protein 4
MVKMLIGRKFDDPDVQHELSLAPFKSQKLPHGGVGISVSYRDEQVVIPAEHYMAMLLLKAKDIVSSANNGLNLGDGVLAVPHWFTNSQRRAMLHACEIAGVNCLKVTNESNAIALSYGIFKSAKKLFSETEPTHVMFIDIGYTGMCVTIVDFIQENMKILSTVCERAVGGRFFDDAIIEYLAETFEKKTKINVRNNKKAILKLQAAAEKAKKTLSPAGVTEANVAVECLAEDRDLTCILTRDEFETRIAPIINRLKIPVEQALKDAGLSKQQLNEIEIVGGSTRVNIVKRVLGEVLGLDPAAMNYGLKTTMNADEAVARGGALQCAMLSSRMKVKPFNIVDRQNYGIVAHFDHHHSSEDSTTHHSDEKEGEADDTAARGSSVPLYARGDELPHKPRRITFRNKSTDFAITLSYDEAASNSLPQGENKFLGRYMTRVPAEYNSAPADVRVTFNIDKHGIVYIQNAQLMEELPMEEEKKGAEGKEGEQSPTPSEGQKKRFKKVDLHVEVEEPGLSREQIKGSLELEATMSYEDKLIVETSDKRNELESYIYAMRDKIDGVLKEYSSNQEKDRFKTLMNSAEDWLYNEGFETTKQEYQRKIDEVRKVGNPIENRLQQATNRSTTIDSLKKQLDMCKQFAANYDEAHAHITDEERDRIRKEVQAIESWLYDSISKQDDLPLSSDPVLTVETINAKRTVLFNATNPIMIKPKPKPAPAPAEEKNADNNNKNEGKKDSQSEGKSAENKDNSEPMDQSKGGPDVDSK